MDIDEVFLPYDIRGIYGKTLTDDLISLIARAAGSLVRRKMVVGRDSRWSSPKISEIVVSFILSTGCDVIDIGQIPNPVLYHYCFRKGLPGLYITASHNSKEYNGMKFCKANGASFLKELKILKRIVKSKKFRKGKGKLKIEKRAKELYISFLKSKIKIKKKPRFVVDAYHGSTALILDDLFKAFGLKPDILRKRALPDFGNIKPEPKPENMRKLIKITKKYDFAVAFDGDGDRAIFVDDSGKIHNGSEMVILFSKFLLKKNDILVASFTCSKSVQKFAESIGAKLFWSKTGHNYIENEILKRDAVFGGEQSSHFYFNRVYPFSDGILSSLILCQILSSSKKSFSELMEDVPHRPTAEKEVGMKNHAQKRKVMSTAKKVLKEVYKWTEIKDGVRFSRNDYIVLIRQSNTSPVIRVQVEADNRKIAKELVERFGTFVLKVKKDYQ